MIKQGVKIAGVTMYCVTGHKESGLKREKVVQKDATATKDTEKQKSYCFVFIKICSYSAECRLLSWIEYPNFLSKLYCEHSTYVEDYAEWEHVEENRGPLKEK